MSKKPEHIWELSETLTLCEHVAPPNWHYQSGNFNFPPIHQKRKRDTKMEYSQIKRIRALCEGLVSAPAWRDVVEKILSGVQDFEVDGVRFVHDDVILSVLADELASDEYICGSFVAWCIAEATGWPVVLIKAAQKAEAYAEIGAAMDKDQVRKLAEIYSSVDGFGHHFNAYDGSEVESIVDGFGLFHIFDNRG